MKSSSKRGRSTSSKNRFKVRSSSPSTSARPTVRVKTIRNPYGVVNVDGNVSTDDFNTEGLDKELLKTVQRAGVVETKHIMKGNIVAIDQENCKEEGGKKIQVRTSAQIRTQHLYQHKHTHTHTNHNIQHT